MAQSVDSLYISLGLNLSELETDFVAAEQTVNENIRRLSRQSELIRLRSEVTIAGLDETADAEQILQTRMDSLNQRMTIQRDRVRLLTAELQSLTNAHGEESAIVQRATLRLEREHLALANLERDLRGLGDAQDESNNAFGELSDLLPTMPTKLQALGMAFGVVTAGIGAATVATQALLEELRELQTQSYELNMSFPDTRDFLRELRLAGGDIGDFEGYIRGISDAWVKGEWDDPEFIALRKYGAEIVDETGRLKNFKDMTEEVYQAWKKADAAGEGIEFLQLTGGEAGVRDAIQYFKRYEEAKEDAAKVFVAKIDDEQLHQLDRTMKLVDEQAGELQKAFGDIFTPAVQAAGEKFFQLFHDGTEALENNKDTIQRWGFIAAETFDTITKKVGKGVDTVSDYLARNARTPETTGDKSVDKVLGDIWRYSGFKPSTKMPWSNFAEASKAYGILNGIVQRVEENQKKYNAAVQDSTKSWADFRREAEKTGKDGRALNQYDEKRVNAFKEQLEDLQVEIEFGDNDYRKAVEELKLWEQRELRQKNFLSDEEREAILAVSAAKLELINKEHAEAIQKYWEDAADISYELTHTAFEKQLRDIELWKDAELEKAETAEDTAAVIANAAAKEAKAFEDAVDRIKGTVQSLEDKIFEIDHSRYENDLRRIQQEYLRTAEELQRQGVFTPELKTQLDYLYSRQKQQLDARADESRKNDGDYTKAPEGALQRGGNNIVVIGADQIIDDGLKQANIGTMVDETRIRAQLLPTISQEARDLANAAQATRDLTDVQKQFVQQTSGFQLIEGDAVANNFQQIEGDQILSAPTAELQQFGDALQQTTANIEDAAPVQKIAQAESALAETLNQAATDFPADYFKTLADNMKGTSDILVAFSNDLIAAHGRLKDTLANSPQGNVQLPTDGIQRLSTSTQDLSDAQDLLARKTREISDIPPLQPVSKNQDKGFEFGFDHDLFGTLATASTTLIGLLQAAGAIAPHPAIKIGALAFGGALGAATAKGTFDAANEQTDDRLKPYIETDLSGLITPLTAIDQNVEAILQRFQSQTDKDTADLGSVLSEYFAPLSNIERYAQDISQAVQSVEFPTEIIVTPLNNIAGTIQQILTALQNRELPAITVSPNIDINLGGAYVFDDALKKALVNDITTDVVVSIKDTVQQATSRASYGFGA